MSTLRNGWVESDRRIGYWLTDSGELSTFIVPRPPEDYFIIHAGKLYMSLAQAEAAAKGSFRVITYGPPQKEPSP